MPEFPSPESISMIPRPVPRSRLRRSAGVIALLSVLTLSNLIAAAMTVFRLIMQTEHGGLDDDRGALLVFGLLFCVVGLVALGGAWCTRKWGPRLYLAAVVVDRVVALMADPGSFSLLLLLGLALAVLLLQVAESDW